MGLLALGRPTVAAADAPPTVVEHIDDVVAFAARNGALPADPGLPSCSNVCNDLWLAEHRPIPGQPSSPQLWGELNQLEGRTGLLPKIGKVLGDAGLAVAAASVGWEVGSDVNAKFLHIDMPPMGYVASDGNQYGHMWLATDQLSYRYFAADDPNGTRSYWPASGSGPPPAPVPLPRDVLVLTNLTSGRWMPYAQSDGGTPVTGPCYETAAGFGPEFRTERFLQDPFGHGCVYTDPATNRAVYVADYNVVTYLLPDELATGPAHDYDPLTDPQPTIVTPSWTGMPAPADVSPRVRDELLNHPDRYPRLLSWIESTIEEPPGKIDMPDCRGLLVGDCLAKLTAAGYTGTHHTHTLAPQDAYVSRPPNTIVKTTPAPGTSIQPDADVDFERNPAPAVMPTVVPAIVPGATPAEVERALDDARLKPVYVTAPQPDPLVGPNVVTHTPTSPRRGARVDPDTAVTVELNPTTAPDPAPDATGGGGAKDTYPFDPGPVPAIDLSPLQHAITCDRFPFGVPCWVSGALGGWSTAGQAPVIDLPIPYWDQTVHLDFGQLDPAMAIIRPVLLAASLLALGWLFMGAAMGFGGNSSTSSED